MDNVLKNNNSNNVCVQQQVAITNKVLEKLNEDSVFFKELPSTMNELPTFDMDECITENVLGSGEFGIVLEVKRFAIPQHELVQEETKRTNFSLDRQGSHVGTTTNNNGGAPPPPLTSILLRRTNSSSMLERIVPEDDDITVTTVGGMDTSDDDENNNNAMDITTAEDDDTHPMNNGSVIIEMQAPPQKEHKRSPSFSFAPSSPMNKKPTITTNKPTHKRGDSTVRIAEDINLIPGGGGITRGYMTTHVLRNDISRYALKRLKHSKHAGTPPPSLDAIVDLACEAKFLSSLNHPNIIKLRATIGKPGHDDFALILDRLLLTLDQKLEQWKLPLLPPKQTTTTNNHRRSLPKAILHPFQKVAIPFHHHPKIQKQKYHNSILYERTLALYDIARAFKYLHEHKIIYRDLKPDNVAFDFRNNVKVFDFGLARELKPCDLAATEGDDFDPNGYELTGLTGSRRYMAPEVLMCQPYGLSADIYSFAILAWQVYTLEVPFEGLSANKHFDVLVNKKKLPSTKKLKKILHHNSSPLQYIIEESWKFDKNSRLTFKQIAELLKTEINVIKKQNHIQSHTIDGPVPNNNTSDMTVASNRSTKLMNASLLSRLDMTLSNRSTTLMNASLISRLES